MSLPSPWTFVINRSLIYKSKLDKYEFGPRSITTSFNARCEIESSLPFCFKSSSDETEWNDALDEDFFFKPSLTIVHFKRVRKRTATLPDITSFKIFSWYLKSNGVRKPNEPIENDRTGGQLFWNILDAWRSVPSPPKQIIKSIFEMSFSWSNAKHRCACPFSSELVPNGRWICSDNSIKTFNRR